MEKLRIYLDADIIYGFFYFKLKVLTGKNENFIEPKIIHYLKQYHKHFDLFISNIVKAEIFRKFLTDFNIPLDEMNKMWKDFENTLEFIELKEVIISDFLLNLVKSEKFKRENFVNMIHLVAAKKLEFHFLTGDNVILEKCKKLYKETISYIELRKILGK